MSEVQVIGGDGPLAFNTKLDRVKRVLNKQGLSLKHRTADRFWFQHTRGQRAMIDRYNQYPWAVTIMESYPARTVGEYRTLEEVAAAHGVELVRFGHELVSTKVSDADVLGAIDRGFTTAQEIGDAFDVQPKTVQKHCDRLIAAGILTRHKVKDDVGVVRWWYTRVEVVSCLR